MAEGILQNVTVARERLNSRQDLNEYLHTNVVPRLKRYAVDAAAPKADPVPDFGVLTETAERTHFFVYDHPAFLKLCDTAFTDGFNVFISAPFLEELIAEEVESSFTRESVLLIMLHELSHKVLEHTDQGRFAGMPHKLVNIAQDVTINSSLIVSLRGRMKLGKVFDDCWGADAPDRYLQMTTEQILKDLAGSKPPAQPAPSPQTGQRSQGQQGQPSQGQQGQPSQGQQGQPSQGQQGQPGQGQGQGQGTQGPGQQQPSPGAAGNSQTGQQSSAQGGQQSGQSGQPQQSGTSGQPGGVGAPSPGTSPSGSPSGAGSTGSGTGTNGAGGGGGSGGGPTGQATSGNGPGQASSNHPQSGSAGAAGRFTASADTHTVTAEDVIKTLAGTPGLKHILGALGYPDATRLEDLNGMREESRRHLKEAMKAARGRMERSNAQGGVGGHIDSALMREYDAVGKPQLNYRSAMRAATLGSGGMLKHAMSEPGDMYSVDPRLMGLSMRRWEGDMIPAEKRRNAFIIMDTSGSVGSDALGMFISELAGLFRYWRDQASKVWLFTGDTAVRGKPQILTPKNYRSVLKNIKAQGGGGTDIDKMIRMVLNNDELMRSGRPKSLMVYSDMMFTPPKRAALPAVIPATYFFYPDTDSYRHAKTWVDRLEKECGTWSKVVPIRKGTTVVLDAPQSAVRRRF